MYGKMIKDALDSKEMTQKELAEQMHVTPQAVSKWIKGESRPSTDNCEAIYKILGINLIENNASVKKKTCSCIVGKDMKRPLLMEIDSFEKAKIESEWLIENSNIKDRYSKPVITLLEWLLPSVIGLSYHQQLHDKEDLEIEYDQIYYNLVDYLDKDCQHKAKDLYDNYLEYNFYLMGGDLFESFEPYCLKNHDYCKESMENWYKFHKSLVKSESSPIYCELLIAISDLADYVYYVA